MHINSCALARVLTLLAAAVAAVAFAGGAAASAPAVQLTDPNGPVTWYVGDECTVSADIADDDGLGYVEFRLSTDDGATFPIVLGGVDGANSVDCVVPNVDTTTARVMVVASDALGNTASDVSDSAFTIKTRPVVADWLTLSPARVVGGSPAQAQVDLSSPAPAGGAVVALASSNPSAAAVPATVTVPEGDWGATFTVSTAEVAASTSVRISASLGGDTVSATLTVAPATAVPPRVASVSLNPVFVVAGKLSYGTVTLTEPALEGGATVELSSSNPAVARVGETVDVPAGETSATFVVSTVARAPYTTVTIGASYGGASASAPLTVVPYNPSRSVAILRADYAMANGKLRVVARTSSTTETLRVYVTATGEFVGTLKLVDTGDYQGKFDLPTNPVQITIISSVGAMATGRVRAY